MNAFDHGPPAAMSARDPLRASIPEILDGDLDAIYYGQRRGGDFYDFVRPSNERVVLGLFDVAGDIQQARPIIARIQQEFRSLGARLFAPGEVNESDALLALSLALNRAIIETAGGVHSCPSFLACYRDSLSTISYVNAGHTPALVRHGHEIQALAATALPLGLFSHCVPDCSLAALAPGDTFLLVSRGITEASYRREEYGIDRIKDYLRQTRFQTAHETCVGMLARVRQFMQTTPTHNDVTVLALVRTKPLV
jgi:sigma-B regulation protein RsbU (phosphoserine phosphatase)